jgi:hypothetical protein
MGLHASIAEDLQSAVCALWLSPFSGAISLRRLSVVGLFGEPPGRSPTTLLFFECVSHRQRQRAQALFSHWQWAVLSALRKQQ